MSLQQVLIFTNGLQLSYGLTSNDILLALQATHTAADEYNSKKPRKMNDNHIVSQWKGKPRGKCLRRQWPAERLDTRAIAAGAGPGLRRGFYPSWHILERSSSLLMKKMTLQVICYRLTLDICHFNL